jgi:hypothetical protein
MSIVPTKSNLSKKMRLQTKILFVIKDPHSGDSCARKTRASSGLLIRNICVPIAASLFLPTPNSNSREWYRDLEHRARVANVFCSPLMRFPSARLLAHGREFLRRTTAGTPSWPMP